ncbi:hypothetical protein [Halovivax gelatinilyticus]|uniref:hypothetical protein n=1 Tax=Halovivax gelatinilyticus TaxID=2961597 RepID=UPI0020CA7C23|nr:hypothetical protein [Halovivax gelatinilyticus]
MSTNPVEIGVRGMTAIAAILWLPLTLTGTNMFELMGGIEIAVMISTVVAMVGVYDLIELSGYNCMGA